MLKIRTFFEKCGVLAWALRHRCRCGGCLHYYPMKGRTYGMCDRGGEARLLRRGFWRCIGSKHLPCGDFEPFFPSLYKGGPRAAQQPAPRRGEPAP